MDLTATKKSESTRCITYAEWQKEGAAMFGSDVMRWAFQCPSCGHVASVQDYKNAGASEGQIGFNCIGRHAGGDDVVEICQKDRGQGCNYTQGGLFTLARTVVVMDDGREQPIFDFAQKEPTR